MSELPIRRDANSQKTNTEVEQNKQRLWCLAIERVMQKQNIRARDSVIGCGIKSNTFSPKSGYSSFFCLKVMFFKIAKTLQNILAELLVHKFCHRDLSKNSQICGQC